MIDNVVITGAGLVTSLGLTDMETWDSLVSGGCGIKPLKDHACPAAARVSGLDASLLDIHPRDSRIMDTHSFMLMKACRDAYIKSGLDSAGVPAGQTGFFAGMGMVDYRIEDLLPSVIKSLDAQRHLSLDAFFSHAYREIHPLWPLSMLNNISFCQVAIDLNIRGENAVFSPNADSGSQAVIEALNSVLDNKTQAALAGGVSEKVSPLSVARGLLSGIFSKEAASCIPFSKNRKGPLPGEGCGIIVLEKETSAGNRGAQPLATITGYGYASEKEKSSACPTTGAVYRSMDEALKKAGLGPAAIDLLMAHGDGTYLGDRNEAAAVNILFEDCIDSLNVYCSKYALGHMLAGAPAADIIIAIHIMKNGIIPGINGSSEPDDDIKFNTPGREPLKKDVKKILINSFSGEGQAVSLVMEEAVR